MSATSLYTDAHNFRKVLATNATGSSAGTQGDLTTEPSEATVGVIDLALGRVGVPNTVLVKFFGAGSNNQTGTARIYGYRKVVSGTTSSWTPVLLWSGGFTLSASVGVAGGVVSASEQYADTITRTVGVENVADQIVSPTGDLPAHLLLDVKGCRFLFVEPIVVDATSVNALLTGV